MLNKLLFFQSIRQSLFDGRMTDPQVFGIEEIVDYWEAHHADKPLAYLAYILATPYFETGRRMQPIHERGDKAYLHQMYDISGSRPKKARELGNLQPGDGVRYAGRGFPQLTGRNNYDFQGRKHGVDLINNPDLMLTIELSVKVLVEGMLDGDFTTKSLSDYIGNGKHHDEEGQFVAARAIINGKDKAAEIAGYALKFLSALEAANDAPLIREPIAGAPELQYDPRDVEFPAELLTDITHDIAPKPLEQAQDSEFLTWKREKERQQFEAEYKASNTKPLLNSMVTRVVIGGVSSFLAVRFGFELPAEVQQWAETAIVAAMGAGSLYGRQRAETFIKGIFTK